MKNGKTISLAVAIVVLITVFATAGGPLEIGTNAKMTDYKMKSVDGSMVSYADVKGDKGTLVIFSCNNCPWVLGWEERLTAIGNWAQENGIGVLYVNSNKPDVAGDSMEEMQQRSEKRGFQFPYVKDEGSEMAMTYGATRTPEAFLFNANDELVYYGTVDDNMRNAAEVESPWLKDAIKAVINGEMPKVQETKALGCTIKFYKSTE